MFAASRRVLDGDVGCDVSTFHSGILLLLLHLCLTIITDKSVKLAQFTEVNVLGKYKPPYNKLNKIFMIVSRVRGSLRSSSIDSRSTLSWDQHLGSRSTITWHRFLQFHTSRFTSFATLTLAQQGKQGSPTKLWFPSLFFKVSESSPCGSRKLGPSVKMSNNNTRPIYLCKRPVVFGMYLSAIFCMEWICRPQIQ